MSSKVPVIITLPNGKKKALNRAGRRLMAKAIKKEIKQYFINKEQKNDKK
jgi:hypothetical protein